MDIIDQASQIAEAELARNISRAAANKLVLPTGVCLFCGEAVEESRSFCDADCRDDWSYLRECDVRNGRAQKIYYYLPE